MSVDEENFERLEPEQVEDMLNWAVGAAAMVTLMKHSPIHENVYEAIQRLNGFLEAVDLMYFDIPEVLVDHSIERATETLEDADENEAIVQQFIQEIEDYDNNNGR